MNNLKLSLSTARVPISLHQARTSAIVAEYSTVSAGASSAFFKTGPPRFSFLCDARAAANMLSTLPDLREL